MTTTGYADTFGRTVANGLGSATSGQAYTLVGTATQFSVAPNTASIAISIAGNQMGLVDLQSGLFVDITGQVALSAIPASNLATVGFASKANTGNNWYAASMMVATGGAVSIRFSKNVTGGLVTLSTVATGLTYVANTFYNLRFQAYYSRILQVNILSAKLWAANTTEPGGWQAVSSTDAAFTDYTTGTQAGLYARDESSVVGTITAKFQSVVSRSYNLPVPSSVDTMCNDPAIAYPDQTALQSLAQAADTAMVTLDPLTSLAGLFPRVRVSASNVTLPSGFFIKPSFAATEFNISTSTNLGYDPQSIYLPVGIWMVTFEIKLADTAVMNQIRIALSAPQSSGSPSAHIRTNTSQLNDLGVGGTGHLAALTYSTDPANPAQVSVNLFPTNTAVAYVISYAALSAIKISDYF